MSGGRSQDCWHTGTAQCRPRLLNSCDDVIDGWFVCSAKEQVESTPAAVLDAGWCRLKQMCANKTETWQTSACSCCLCLPAYLLRCHTARQEYSCDKTTHPQLVRHTARCGRQVCAEAPLAQGGCSTSTHLPRQTAQQHKRPGQPRKKGTCRVSVPCGPQPAPPPTHTAHSHSHTHIYHTTPPQPP